MYDVFLSYRHKSGSEFASFLNEKLTNMGYNCFFDAQSLRSGKFEEKIDKAIDQCTYFLVILSTGDLKNSVKDPENDWIIHESKRALEAGKLVIPIAIKANFKFPRFCKIPTIKELRKYNICPLYGANVATLIESLLVKEYMHDHPYKELSDEYNKGIITPDYIEWELQTLKNIYADIPFVKAFGKEFPAYVIAASNKIKYPFDDLTQTYGSLQPINDEIDYKNTPLYNDFLKIVGPNVHYPDLYGYTSVGFNLDAEDKILGLNSLPRTYKETVFTCHILQYELWRAYKKLGKERLATLEDLPMRKKIHQDKSNLEVILSGCNRSCLNDVAIALIDYNQRTNEYNIATATRSTEVATQPGYFGFVPSGGFELYELENNQNESIIEENYSVISALYREYIEEIFGDENFEKPTGNDDLNRLYRNSHIQELRQGVKNGTYQFEFLGIDFDLTTLRQTLAFGLRIDDEYFFNNNAIMKNSENNYIRFESLRKIEDNVKKAKLPVMSESAATWALLQESKLFKEIVANDYNLIK